MISKFQTTLGYVVKTVLKIIQWLDKGQRALLVKCLLPRHSDLEFDISTLVNVGANVIVTHALGKKH